MMLNYKEVELLLSEIPFQDSYIQDIRESDYHSFTLSFFNKEEKAYVGLGFRFPRYGAFVEYGAGRGYVVKDGVVYRGFTDYTDKELRGLRVSKYTLQRRKHIVGMNVKRKPLPWLDPQIVGNIDDLADVAGEYYGDRALRSVLEKFNRITIRKSYGK